MGFEKINEDTYVCDDGHVRFFLIVGETEALLDLNSGMLFSGDPIQRNGRIFMFGPMRDISAYILSLERLLALNDEIKEIYPCHGTYPVGMDVVPELIAGAKKIESREIIPTIIEVFGTNVAEYDIGGNVLLCDAQEKECPQEE